MPAMDMTAMNMPPNSRSPIWFSAVNWIGTVGFAVAVSGHVRFVMEQRQERPSQVPGKHRPNVMAAGSQRCSSPCCFRSEAVRRLCQTTR